MIIAVIQARMSSKRFPGKVMKEIFGKPLLWYLVERLKRSKRIDKIIIATTVNKADDKIAAFAERNTINFFRGSEEDVLGRYYNASINYAPDYVFRITADCPLVDPRHCDMLVNKVLREKADYACLGQTFAEGTDCEIFTFNALTTAYKNATTKLEREHVTLYIHNNSHLFKKGVLENTVDDSKYRFTVDEVEDFEVVKAIIEYFYKKKQVKFGYKEIKKFLDDNPNIYKLNSKIIRNERLLNSLDKKEKAATPKLVQKINPVLIRTDGSSYLGVGHILRCLGLAQEFERLQIKPIFVTKSYDKQIPKIIKKYNYQVILMPKSYGFEKDADLTIKTAVKYGSKIIIADLSNSYVLSRLNGYKNYVGYLRKNIKTLVAIDGFGEECISTKIRLPFDIVIIPYLVSEKKIYKKFPFSEFLLGTNYVIFRKEFLKEASEQKKIVESAQNILITLGGGNNSNLLLRILKAFNYIENPYLKIKVILGFYKDELIKKSIRDMVKSRRKIEFVEGINNITKVIRWADVAIISSGLTIYEMALLGTPAMVISRSTYATKSINEFSKSGLVLHLGQQNKLHLKEIALSIKSLIRDKDLRSYLSTKGRELVDGKGVKRVISAILMKNLL